MEYAALKFIGVGLLSFGLMGAALWAVGAMAFNFVLNLYYYRRVRKDLENQEHEQHDHGL